MNNLKSQFLLDPNIIFLNHGSFGACPKQVFSNYQEWQRKLEEQPVLFLGREYAQYDTQVRTILGKYLSSSPEDIALIPNATYGVNLVARSLSLRPGDEILTTNHEYGACDYTWELVCKKSGAKYIHQPIPFPCPTSESLVSELWKAVTPQTKLIFMSHIASPTAMHFPVELVCRKARENNILTLIDGAHAPGQIPLNMKTIHADFYVGNCHKWMLSPKGAGFLYTHKKVQNLIEPLVVSWGFHYDETNSNGSKYIDYLQWSGTKDPAAFFTIPSAIDFMEKHHWPTVIKECSDLLQLVITQFNEITGFPSLLPITLDVPRQMGVAELPPETDVKRIKTLLYDDFKIEVPIIEWEKRKFIRISIQGYNTQAETNSLIKAMSRLLS